MLIFEYYNYEKLKKLVSFEKNLLTKSYYYFQVVE